jgi:hypothetical protein
MKQPCIQILVGWNMRASCDIKVFIPEDAEGPWVPLLLMVSDSFV